MRCVACGAQAGLFCAGCRVTPYCAERCQRRDWDARHHGLCHNLARLNDSDETEASSTGESALIDSMDAVTTNGEHAKSPRNYNASKKAEAVTVSPAGIQQSQRRDKQVNGHRDQDVRPRNQVQARLNQSATQDSNRNQDKKGDRDENGGLHKTPATSTHRFTPDYRPPLRQPVKQQDTKPTPEPKPLRQPAEAAKPTPKPAALCQPAEAAKLTPEPVAHREPAKQLDTKPAEAAKPTPEPTATTPGTEPVKPKVSRMGTTCDVTPRKPLIPTSYLIEKLPIGSTFVAEVISLASACGSTQSGFVCLTLHEDYGEVYNQLCDEFSAQCQSDCTHYTPRIGETFAYLSPEDEGWYRARCLAPTLCALLDAGRVVSFTPSACRRLPKAYSAIPEFIAVLQSNELQIGANISCTVLCKEKVCIADESGKSLGDVQFGRWTPDVEYPAEPVPSPMEPTKKESPITPPVDKPSIEPKRTKTPKVAETRVEPKVVKLLVPTTYLVEKLPVGATFLAEVISLASACGSTQSGFVCLTLHEDYGEVYNQLCDEFSAQCQSDCTHYTPRIGETFAYLSPEDEGWYRARCLAPTLCALLDAGRVVSFTPSACRRLPKAYSAIPEFIAVLQSKELQIGANISCTVLCKEKVCIADESGKSLGDVQFGRWTPDVEYPVEPAVPSPMEPTKKESPITPPVDKPSMEPKRTKTPKVEPKRTETPKVAETRVEPKAVKPLVPATYLVENLPVGATFLAEVISLASACGSTQSGFVCLTLHEDYGEVYNQLCDEFSAQCQSDCTHYTPAIGETFAYLCPEDEGWYRARCLAPTRSALLDSGRVVSFTPAMCRRLPNAYARVPEFMAVLNAKKLQIGANLSCTITGAGDGKLVVTVTVEDNSLSDVDVTRWTPRVEYPKIEPPRPASTAAIGIPQVPRPALENNTLYTLLDVTSLSRACVRVSDGTTTAAFQSALHDTVLYGHNAKPLAEPPRPGDTVVAKCLEEGVHYRALVKRVNIAKNKYLIEYIEYGNEEVATLDRLYPCPEKLRLETRPAVASFVKLSDRQPDTLSQPAKLYIEKIKDSVDLVLTIPSGEKAVASGALGKLHIAKTMEPASLKIEELCTPEWRRLAERGGDVLETESRCFADLKYWPVPLGKSFELCVVNCDLKALAEGALSGYPTHDRVHDAMYEELYQQIEEYCNSPLCREPYLPRIEELCIVMNEKDNKWARSVIAELTAGESTVRVVYIDTGELACVSVTRIRKMLPSFVDEFPARAHDFEIKDFPAKVTRVQLERAMSLAQRGVRAVANKLDGIYSLSSPDLIAALTG